MTGTSIVNVAVRKTLLSVTPFFLLSLLYLYATDEAHAAARAIGVSTGALNLIAAAAVGGWASNRSFTWATAITLASFVVRLAALGVLFAYLVSRDYDPAQVLISFAAATTVCLAVESVFLMATKE